MDWTKEETYTVEVLEDKPWKDPDMSHLAQDFYRIFWPDVGKRMKGYLVEDSRIFGEKELRYARYALGQQACSPQYRSMFHSRFRGDTLITFNSVFNVRRRSKWEEYSLHPENRMGEFEKGYHCLANFMPQPWGLNHWRAFGFDPVTWISKPRFRDCPDLYFDQIRKWFRGDDLDSDAEREFQSEPYISFFCSFENWSDFAEKNYLIGSFANNDDDLTVRYLFERGEGSDTKSLLSRNVLPQGIKEIAAFVGSAFDIWAKRAKVLAEAAPARLARSGYIQTTSS